MRVEIHDFSESDELVVNGVTVNAAGEAPPEGGSREPEAPEKQYNDFGDYLAKNYGKSLTFNETVETEFFFNKPLKIQAGGFIDVFVPEEAAGRTLTLGNASTKSSMGTVRVVVDGERIASEELPISGSIQIPTDDVLGKTVRYRFADGGESEAIQFACYPAK